MNSLPNLLHCDDLVGVALNPRGTISRALAELQAQGGPELDILGLADQVQVSADCLQRLNQGQLGAVDLVDLERLCCILGRSPNDLLGYESDI